MRCSCTDRREDVHEERKDALELIAREESGSYRAVGALVGCDHQTVKRYVEAAGEAGQLAPALTRSRVTDDFAELIGERSSTRAAG